MGHARNTVNPLNFPEIPPDRIAQSPRAQRDAARLLVLRRSDGSRAHQIFRDLPNYFEDGDGLVLNDVRVLPARLVGKKSTGGKVSVLLLARFPGSGPERWTALVTPRPRPGNAIHFPEGFSATVVGDRAEGEWELVFSLPLLPTLDRWGGMPLPPYIKRPLGKNPDDDARYQTVFSVPGVAQGEGPLAQGAVAAPTAGLHFTAELLDGLRRKGVRVVFVTLWVGWGTFRPLATEDFRAHRMLPEPYRVPPETAEALRRVRADKKKVWAVGTTAVRALESATGADGIVRAGSATASLFITPGYRFRAVDRLVTNFHMTGHTPLLLAAAFAGTDLLRQAYDDALARAYLFFSYGDSMAIL